MTIGLTSITLRVEGTKITVHLPLVTGSHDGSVKIWDIESLMSPKAAADVAELQVFTLMMRISACSLTPTLTQFCTLNLKPLIEFRKPPPPRQRLDLSVSGIVGYYSLLLSISRLNRIVFGASSNFM